LDKIRALWLIAFPLCIVINVLVVVSLGYGNSAYGKGLVFILVPTYFLYLLFLGIEESYGQKRRGKLRDLHEVETEHAIFTTDLINPLFQCKTF